MRRLPYIAAGSTAAAVIIVLGVVLWFEPPEPEDAVAVSAAAISLALLAMVGLVGFLATHGKWARRTMVGTLASALGLLAIGEPSGPWWLGVAATSVSLAVAAGPGLDRWTRRLPPPDALPWEAIILPLGLLATGLIGLAAHPSPVATLGWLAVSVVTAWAYARAYVAGLWAARLLVPAVGVWAAATTPSPWQAALAAAWAIGAAVIAWREHTARAVVPLVPRPIQARPVFAEMAPPEVREAAGLDDRGRPR